ncbi:hypothetical protein PVT67_15665 [Gallaecimonas kandeliae]|uniref:hypothetical protein n=1 Tax=Gallaecimonas kandeliae TaxID=3029055 RepID=UPI002648FAEE|nr:hypothetical protein [Gallaecimonas kandeliae]WKE65080.1 hypothetical protein PVT67_15665 [Gallaecimonas kandeliae]
MPLPAGAAAIFPFAADWSSPVRETREYKTDIIPARSGTEQRRALRSKPRQGLAFDLVLDGSDANAFDYQLYALQPHYWLLPLWQRQRRLAAPALTGANTLVLDQPLAFEAQAGDDLVLMRAGQAPEAQQIESLSTDRKTITLADVLAADWPQHASLYPASQAQLTQTFNATRPTAGLVKASLAFELKVDNRAPAASSLSSDLTIGGLEVLQRGINWVDAPEVGFTWAPQRIDGGNGPTSYVTVGDLAPNTRKGTVSCDSRDELDWWLAFFDRCRGRQKPFLMPTWLDLNLQQPLTAGATFEVAGTELGTYLADDPVHSHLMVRLWDGSLAFFAITGLTVNAADGVTVINTAEAWGEAYNPWQCLQACLVTSCRLASDRLEVEWVTDEVASFALAVQLVEDVA